MVQILLDIVCHADGSLELVDTCGWDEASLEASRERICRLGRDLAIIGNGFDRATGINSSYADFREFFWEQAVDATTQGFFGQVDIAAESAWWNFEEALGHLELPSNEEYLEYTSSGDPGEVDSLQERASRDAQDFRLTVGLLFNEWVRQLNKPSKKPGPVVQLVSSSSLFLSFNYTPTLEEFFGIPCDRVLHVHGGVGGGQPYFGCPQAQEQERFQHENPAAAAALSSGNADLRDSFVKTPRVESVQDFIQNRVPLHVVRSYGFSFGPADLEYVRTVVAECAPDALWINYCNVGDDEHPDSSQAAKKCNEVLVDQCGFTGRIEFRRA